MPPTSSSALLRPRVHTEEYPALPKVLCGLPADFRNTSTFLTGPRRPDEEKILKCSRLKLQRPESRRKKQNHQPSGGCESALTKGCSHSCASFGISGSCPGGCFRTLSQPGTKEVQEPPLLVLQVGFLAGCPLPLHRRGHFLLGLWGYRRAGPASLSPTPLPIAPVNSFRRLMSFSPFLHLMYKHVCKLRQWSVVFSPSHAAGGVDSKPQDDFLSASNDLINPSF